ncbi:hypothetical protein [Pseudorhodoplanes sinuspersici]|uniref:Uncharacterized protein n=1 Tax=Pseudorhodoplanes sinuspersici TaxID=1235591 RepID=A0A1W6ZY56_9HYPH|nr:hypothetical protein [Pseudorhodoplanes sinuspersici]ARQ02337.1 hypothetical protein CAK95_26955 [Pseudorhodoplanes sinuspersici]RKE74165.1 hypothetical protein DFP91_2068 [Pseudorhodoplanes sinuspersici]
MRHKSEQSETSERIVKDIRRATRKHYSAEEKIRIVLDGLRAFSGDITASGSDDTLTLGGSAEGSFDLSSICVRGSKNLFMSFS